MLSQKWTFISRQRMPKALVATKSVRGKVQAFLDHDGEIACRHSRARLASKHRLAVESRIEYAETISRCRTLFTRFLNALGRHILHLTDGQRHQSRHLVSAVGALPESGEHCNRRRYCPCAARYLSVCA